MKAFVIKIWLSLLIIALMTSTVVAKGIHIETNDNYARRTPNIKNSTDGYKQDAAGIRRAVAALPANIFNNPNQACYTQFFGNGQPPTGLRTANLANMRYICQQVPAHAGTYFYATMFDEGRGIPVYSAYALNANNVNFVAQAGGGWIQTNGIVHQGSNAIYTGQPAGQPRGQRFQRGHLFADMTASGLPQNAPIPLNAQTGSSSTYQFTNAVPQRGSFNMGQWRVWEGRIRTYAANVCIPSHAELYLITGVSFVGITNANPPQAAPVPIATLPPAPPNNPAAIDIPNTMWTAGMCVSTQGGPSYSFAVIGNNVHNVAGMFTKQITVAQLEAILQADIVTNGVKRSTAKKEKVSLFPAIKNPQNYDKELPEDKFPEPLPLENEE